MTSNHSSKSEKVFKDDDVYFMKQAIQEAEKGLGRTSPNPPVGAVIVKNGRIIGRGYHHKAGDPHAEVEALNNAFEDVRGAEIYVTLEPCNHYGKTPPCSLALLKAGIKRVIFAVSDTTSAGGGGEFLKSNGIEVVSGICKDEAYEQLKYFFKSVNEKRPYVLYKSAMTLDGKTATSEKNSKYITNSASLRLVHKWRNELDAVMIGSGTLKYDDPELTYRGNENGRNPVRIVVNSDLKAFKGNEKLLKTIDKAPLWIVCSSNVSDISVKKLENIGVKIIKLPTKNHISINDMLKKLHESGINSILLEGGATLAGSFLKERKIDEIAFFYAPKLMAESENTPGAFYLPGVKKYNLKDLPQIINLSVKILDGDVLIKGKLRYF